MPRLLTLSRAARLVGVRRGALQKKIKAGELSTFEGMISLPELLRAYPDTQFEHSAILERVERIKDEAMAKRIEYDSVLPNPEVLESRVNSITQELAKAKTELSRYSTLFERLKQKLADLGKDSQAQATAQWLSAWLQNEWEQADQAGKPLEGLLARDSLLRMVAAHVQVEPLGHEFFVEGSDTLLQAALAYGLGVDYGCSDGSCGRCKAKLIAGETRQIRAPTGAFDLKPDEVLMCCATPVADVVIDAHEISSVGEIAAQSIMAWVNKLEHSSEKVGVLELKTPPENRLRFLAGQRVMLQTENAEAIECAVASCPCEDRRLQFHVHLDVPLFANLREGNAIKIEGPIGDFQLNTQSHHSLIFIAIGTGFAAVKGLIEQAQSRDIAEAMHLYWIVTSGETHYLHNLCRAWADALDNFFYIPMSWNNDSADNVAELTGKIRQNHPVAEEYDYYFAGPKSVIAPIQAELIQNGAPAGQCFTEALD